jgi:hypothetical protein
MNRFDTAIGLIIGIVLGNVAYEIDGYAGIAWAVASMASSLFSLLAIEAHEKRKTRVARRDSRRH